MPTIDQRIVEMQFDNAQFEKGVAQSLKTLDALKKGLNLDKVSDSLANVEHKISRLDFSGIANGINQIKWHFTALGRWVDRHIDSMVHSIESKFSVINPLSGANLSGGMGKYETQTKAVQTITNATGKSVAEVEEVLGKLMKYTDETSYDFVEMASSIGKFTSVGVELEKAERAMEGIANEAALSGAGKAEANRAMYNFAQALSAGSVKLIDWKSIENANMATKEFKEELIKTAIEMGTIKKKGDAVGAVMKQTSKATKKSAAQFKETEVNYKTFNQTLSEGWLTSDVLINTLERYADKDGPVGSLGRRAYEAAQKALTLTDAIDAIADAITSSWMTSFKYMFGDLNEAMDLWTNFCNAIIAVEDEFSSYRNELLKGWHEQGGYNAMIEAASNIWGTFCNILHMVKDAFAQVFPPATAENIVAVTEKIRDVTASWKQLLGYNEVQEVEEEVMRTVDYAEQFEEAIKKGADSEYVKLFQKTLMDAGYSLDRFGADGIYGPETRAAIIEMQKDLGVKQTGEWDEATRKAAMAAGIFKMTEKSVESVKKELGDTYKTVEEYEDVINYADRIRLGLKRSNKKDNQVKILQDHLVRLGYLDKAQADGIFGPKTEQALKDFQKANGLAQTGVWDEDTFRKTYYSGLFKQKTKLKREVTHTVGAQTETMNRLQKTVKGLASVISIIKSYLDTGVKVFKHFLSLFSPIAEALLRIVSVIGVCFSSLREDLEKSGYFDKLYKNAKKFLVPLGNLLSNIGKSINDFFDRHPNISTFTELWDAVWEEFTQIPFVAALLEKIQPILTRLSDFFNKIKGPISDFFNALNESIVGFFTADVSSGGTFIERLQKRFEAFGSIGDWFKKTFSAENIDAGIENIKSIWGKIGSIFEEIKKVAENVVNFVKEFKIGQIIAFIAGIYIVVKLLKGLKSLIAPLEIVKNIAGVIESVGDYIDTARKTLKQNSLYRLIAGLSIGIGLLAFAVSQLAKLDQANVWSSVGAIGAIMAAIIGFSVAMNKLSPKGFAKSTKGILKLSISMAIMSLAIANMSRFDPTNVWSSVGAIGAILLMIGLFSTAMQKLKIDSIDKNVKGILVLSIALVVISFALEKLADLSWEQLAVGLSGIGGLLIEFGIFLRLMPKQDTISKALTVLPAMAGFLAGVADPFKKIAQLSWDELTKGIAGLGGILLEFGLFLRLTNGTEFKTGIVKLIGIGVAVFLLGSSLKKLSKLSWEGIAKGILGLGAVLLEFGIFLRMTDGKKLETGFLKMLGVGLAIVLLAKSLETISKIDWTGIAKGLVGLGGIFLELALFMKLVNGNNGLNSFGLGVAMIGIGTAIMLFAKAISGIADISWGGIAKSIITLGAIFLEIAIFMKMINGNSGFKQIGLGVALIGIGTSLLLFAEAIRSLAKIKGPYLLKAILALGAIFLEISILLKKVRKTGAGKMLSVSLLMASIGVSLNLVAFALRGIGSLPFGNIVKGIIAIAFVFSQMKKLMNANASIKSVSSSIFMLIAIAGSLLVFGIAMNAVAGVPWSTIISVGVSLKLVIDSMSKSLALLSKIPVTGALNAIANLDIFIANLLLVLGAIGGLQELTNGGLGEWLEKGALALGQAIGGFIKGIVSPFQSDTGVSKKESSASSIADYLNNLIGDLSNVMDTLEPFLDRVGSITEDKANGVLNLVKILAAMSGEEILDSISGWVSKSLNGGEGSGSGFVDFAMSLVEVVPYLRQFSEEAGGINDKNLQKASTSLGYFGDIAAATLKMTGTEILDSIGGWISAKVGGGGSGSAFVDFADSLTKLVPKLVSFSKHSSRINSSAISAVANAMGPFGQVAEAAAGVAWSGLLTNIASFVSGLLGQDDFLTFADKLSSFVPKLIALSSSLTGEINSQGIADLAAAMTSFGTISKETAAIAWNELLSGIAEFITGKETLPEFVDSLIALAPKLVLFGSLISNVDTTAISGSAGALQALSDVANKIPGANGLVQKIFGEHDIGAFGSQLVTLGSGLLKFYNKTKDIPENYDPQPMVNALTGLAGVAEKIPGAGGFVQAIVGDKSLEDFGNSLGILGSGLNDFVNATKDIPSDYNADGPVKALTALSELEKELEAQGGLKQWLLGEKNLGEFGNQVGILGNNLKSFFDATKNVEDEKISGIASAISAIAGAIQSVPASDVLMDNVGGLQYLLDSLPDLGYEGLVETGRKVISGIFLSVAETVSNEKTTVFDAWKKAGKSIIDGLINGLNENVERFIASIQEVAISGYEAFREILGINSPSREFMAVAGYIIGGLVEGLSKNSGAFIDKNVDIAKRGLMEFREKLGIHSNSTEYGEIGKYMMGGLTEALKKYEVLPENALSDISSNLLEAGSDLSSMFGDFFGGSSSPFGDSLDFGELFGDPTEYAREMLSQLGDKINLEDFKVDPKGFVKNIVDSFGDMDSDITDSLSSFLTEGFSNLTKDGLPGAEEILKDVDSLMNSDDDYEFTVTPVVDDRQVELFEKTLKKGMVSDDVKQMQKMLMSNGYNLDKYGADGIYGPETKAAVKQLQRDLKVAQTGVWDEATRKAAAASDSIKAAANASSTLSFNQSRNLYTNIGEQSTNMSLSIAEAQNAMTALMTTSKTLEYIAKRYNEESEKFHKENSLISTKIDTVSRTVGNMKLVMDTGAVVGQIAPAMDKALGRRAVAGERGRL